MAQYRGTFAWKPLIRNSEVIRNLNFATSVDYYEGSRSGKVETRTEDITVGILFENGGSIDFTTDETFDRLTRQLNLPPGNPRVGIAAGDYSHRAYTASFRSGTRYRIGGNGNITWGEFYNGNRRSFTGNVTWVANSHLNTSLRYDRNRVVLPNGEFTTNLVATRILYGFNPRLFLNAFVQYNADTHQVSTNIRFNWTHHPLSDLFIVYSDTRDTISGQYLERAFNVKLTPAYPVVSAGH